MDTHPVSTELSGYLFDENRTVKDDAASVRRTLKTMQKAGLIPADVKISVRYRTASMMQAIDVRCSIPRPMYACEPDRYKDPHALNTETGEWVTAHDDRLTIEARTIRDTCRELLAAHDREIDRGAYCRPLNKFVGDVTIIAC